MTGVLLRIGTYLAVLTGIVAVLVCVGYAFWELLWLTLTEAGRALGPFEAGTRDSGVEPVGPAEPAHRAYWSRQMWLDYRRAGRRGFAALRRRLTDGWLRRNTRQLLRGRRPSGPKGENPFTQGVFVLVGPGTGLGALLAALLAALFTLAAFAVFGLLLGLVWCAVAAEVLLLRGVERGWLLVRGVRTKCPYPGCYRPVPLAVHTCPGCDARHRRLRPGRYGALWHVCSCGRRLPTVLLARRGRLALGCPHCDQSLPAEVGTTRVVHLPLVGGTSSGKTMLMAAIVAGLHSWTGRSRLTVEYATPADRQTATALLRQLEQTVWANATTGGQPRALMLRIGYGRRRRLLYLYDPMGESLSEAGNVRAQQYLAHTDGVILVTDVLADPQVRRALNSADAQRVGDARPAALGPWDTYQRLTGELSALTGRRHRLPLATVVTKRDVLDQLSSLPVPGSRVDDWLRSIELDGLVRAVEHDFGTARYWAISARAATGTGALDGEQRRAAEPVLWLLARTGLRTSVLLTESPEARIPARRGGGEK